ncbi:MAG: type II toxin-antitoxin system PrlF family antitoxin [Dehalococcoidia bacterium]|nr:type II toxin-antitoxin system PrlF family antitoxin [Dehalococcoidia bacterium]
MKEVISTITSKGQITIPAEVRRHLGVQSHDKVAFVIEREGEVKLKVPRYRDIDSIVGKAGSLKHPLSWHEMRTIAKEDRIKQKYPPKL